MNIEVVIFDWDGTIDDTVDHVASSLHLAVTEFGLPELEKKVYRNIVGISMVHALKVLYPSVTDFDVNGIREAYCRHFFAKEKSPQQVFSGMTEVINELRDNRKGRAIATGKSRKGLDIALQSSGLRSLFDITRCAEESRSKPHPAMLEEILRFYNVSPNEAIMIGDTTFDLEMAQRIGMPSIGVDWGSHGKETLGLWNPRAIVGSVNELRRELGLK